MRPSVETTIFARASGAGKAGVVVFRISGPAALAIAEKLVGRATEPRLATLVNVRSPESGAIIDAGVAIAFHGPASFTGEDVVELQLHGSRAVERALYEALTLLGAEPAAPGEFTRRALINGKLDLAQVEGLADLIDAETNRQRMQALGQLGGRLSALATGLRQRLIEISAPLEADIDFPDEEGVPAAVAASAGPRISAMIDELNELAAGARAGSLIRDGVDIAIVGAPNAGKSSLLNSLAGDDKAIVSDQPGTTRDIVEVRIDIDGVAVTFADTAGLRADSDDAIEKEGMRRTAGRARSADLRLWMIDVSRETMVADAAAIPARFPEMGGMGRTDDIVVFNKIDLLASSEALPSTVGGMTAVAMSLTSGHGLDRLRSTIAERVRELTSASDSPLLSRARHVQAVERALGALQAAQGLIGQAPELAAEEVRRAASALGEITGAVNVEDVLGEIFSSFCIGK
jgi:tRNA modification GTPase